MSPELNLGVSWGVQLFATAISFAFGMAGGVPSLLFFRKSSVVERILTDFFACACLIGLYLLSVELGSRGQLTWYTPVAFFCGACFFIKLKATIFRFLAQILGKLPFIARFKSALNECQERMRKRGRKHFKVKTDIVTQRVPRRKRQDGRATRALPAENLN